MEWALVILAGVLFYFFKNYKFEKAPAVPADAVQVVSPSSGEAYHISPGQLSCTCPDWFKRRQQFQKSDPRRLCKHLVQFCIGRDKLPASLSLYQEALEWYHERGWSFPIDKKIMKLDSPEGEIAYFKGSEDQDWYNICFQGKRYGWNSHTDKWSEGTPDEIQGVFFRAKNGIDLSTGEIEIETVESIQLDSPKDWRINGVVEGEPISAVLNLHGATMNFGIEFAGEKFSYNLRYNEVNSPKMAHLAAPLSRWISAEKERLRSEMKKK